MLKFKRGTLPILCLLGLATLLCGACGANKGTTSSSGNTNTQTETILTDALGHQVAVPDEPKRIIGSYLEDYLVALGEKPVAQWTVGGGSIQDYLSEELADVPTINYDLSYEDVLSFEPDLLLIDSNSMVEGGKYEQYQKIAPTYVVTNGADVSWRDRLTDIATVLNKEEQGEEVLKDYDTLIQETKEELGNKIADKSVAVLWVTNNSAFMVSDDKSSGQLLYQELGFQVPNLTEEISGAATADWSAVSLEKLAELDADYVILVNSDQGASLFNEQVWQNIPAVKNNQVWEFGPETSWLYNGPIAYTQMIEDVKEQLK